MTPDKTTNQNKFFCVCAKHSGMLPALGRQGKLDLCEFEAILVYKESSRTARAIWRNPNSKKSKEKKSK